MSKVSEVFDRVVEAVEGEPPTNIMAALTAVSAMVIHDTLLDGRSVDDALTILNKQIKEHIARIEKEKH